MNETPTSATQQDATEQYHDDLDREFERRATLPEPSALQGRGEPLRAVSARLFAWAEAGRIPPEEAHWMIAACDAATPLPLPVEQGEPALDMEGLFGAAGFIEDRMKEAEACCERCGRNVRRYWNAARDAAFIAGMPASPTPAAPREEELRERLERSIEAELHRYEEVAPVSEVDVSALVEEIIGDFADLALLHPTPSAPAQREEGSAC